MIEASKALPAFGCCRRIVVMAIAMLAVSGTVPVLASETLCVRPLADGFFHEHPDETVFGISASALIVPGYAEPLLDLAIGLPIATIRDGRLEEFHDPPLTDWNRLLPVVVRTPGGHLWAYNLVRPGLFHLDRASGQFVRHPLSDTPGLRGFTSSSSPRRLDGRRVRVRDGLLFAYVDDGFYRVDDDALVKFKRPEGWVPLDMTPTYFTAIDGYLTMADRRVWFRKERATEWTPVASIDAPIGSLYRQEPYDRLEVVYSPRTGDLFLLLDDRVLVGRFGPDDAAPRFAYQFAGKAFVHGRTDAVLAWGMTKPQRRWMGDRLWLDRPRWHETGGGLWRLTPEGPVQVPGFRAKPYAVGSNDEYPVAPAFFHAPSQTTLVRHATGFAAFDGERLSDLPAWSDAALGVGHGPWNFERVGSAVLLNLPSGVWRLRDDLGVEPVALPESPKGSIGRTLFRSDALDTNIVAGAGMGSAYATRDFRRYDEIGGASEYGLSGILADMPDGTAAIGYAARAVMLVRKCAP